jgi:hypothetical protein
MAKTKSGYVYLLKSQTCHDVFKVGCTTLHPNQRAKRISVEYKRRDGIDYKFSVIYFVKVKSPYSVESYLKAYLVPSGFCMMSEGFHLSLCDFDEHALTHRFRSLIKKSGAVIL